MIYTCIGKGGAYELLGTAIGAGTSRGTDVVVYRDAATGQLFHRTQEDWAARMEPLQDCDEVGVDNDGNALCWNAVTRQIYNCGEPPAEAGAAPALKDPT